MRQKNYSWLSTHKLVVAYAKYGVNRAGSKATNIMNALKNLCKLTRMYGVKFVTLPLTQRTTALKKGSKKRKGLVRLRLKTTQMKNCISFWRKWKKIKHRLKIKMVLKKRLLIRWAHQLKKIRLRLSRLVLRKRRSFRTRLLFISSNNTKKMIKDLNKNCLSNNSNLCKVCR